MNGLVIEAGGVSTVKDFNGPRGIMIMPLVPKNGPGSPTKMTPHTAQLLREAFSMDCTIAEACIYANISRTTFYTWKEEDPELFDTFDALRDSVALKARKKIAKDVDTSFDNAMRYMAKKKPDEFGDKMKLEHSGGVSTTPVPMTPEIQAVVTDFNAKLREAIAAPHTGPKTP